MIGIVTVNRVIRTENRVMTAIVADLVPKAGTAKGTGIGSENVTATIGGAAEVGPGIDGGVVGPGVVTADVRGSASATIGAAAVRRIEHRTENGNRGSRTVVTITRESSSPRA